MAKFTKSILRPGTYHLPDGKVWACSLGDLEQIGQTAKEMIASGHKIPLAVEHQDGAYPRRDWPESARRAAAVIGWVEDVNLSGSELIATLECDDSDASTLLRKIRYCSPEIATNFADELKTWNGPSITHLAATPSPVIPGQQPFVALSRVRLSLEKIKGAPVDFAKIASVLEEKGIILPAEGMNEENFVIILETACANSGGDDYYDDDDDDDFEDDDDGGGGLDYDDDGGGGGQVIDEEIQEEPNNTMAFGRKTYEKMIAKLSADRLIERVRNLTRKGVTKDQIERLISRVNAEPVRLSRTKRGVIPRRPVEATIEEFEALPDRRSLDGKSLVEHARPEEGGSRSTPDDFFATVGK